MAKHSVRSLFGSYVGQAIGFCGLPAGLNQFNPANAGGSAEPRPFFALAPGSGPAAFDYTITATATEAILRDTLREALARKIFWGLFGLYHMMPKVFDISRLILDFIRDGKVGSLLPVYTSAAFGTVMLAASIYIFRKRDF